MYINICSPKHSWFMVVLRHLCAIVLAAARRILPAAHFLLNSGRVLRLARALSAHITGSL